MRLRPGSTGVATSPRRAAARRVPPPPARPPPPPGRGRPPVRGARLAPPSAPQVFPPRWGRGRLRDREGEGDRRGDAAAAGRDGRSDPAEEVGGSTAAAAARLVEAL